MKLFTSALLFWALAIGLSACSERREKSTPSQTIYVLGDPRSVIKNTKLNAEFDFKKINSSDRIVQILDYAFVEKAPYKKSRSQKEIEKSNSTSENNKKLQKVLPLKVTDLTITRVTFESNSEIFSIFKKNDKYYYTSNNGLSGEILHTSFLSENKKFFSLLIYSDNNFNSVKSLVALYFQLNPNSDFIELHQENDYEYILGRGIKFKWKKSNSLDLASCGSPPTLSLATQKAVNEWAHVLKGRLNFESKELKSNYPPFSDLNSRCLYLADLYRAWPNPDEELLGATFSISNLNDRSIIDSDIIIFKNEFEKSGISFYDPRFIGHIYRTVLHEIGHFLGLGHEFSGHESIMSYERDLSPYIFDHDMKAAQALYE